MPKSVKIAQKAMYEIFCRLCRKECAEEKCRAACLCCGGPLEFRYTALRIPSANPTDHLNSMWRYRDLLPIRPTSQIVTLGEGRTPLQRARCYSDAEVYIKNETLNPTGSHKDRALSIGLTKAVEFGHNTVMLYSDGSTAVSSAAYSARAGVRNIVVVPRGTPQYRVLPLMIFNSLVLEYDGTAQEALDWVHQASRALEIYETSTYRRANPYGVEGSKTIGYEIFEQLGRSPDWVVVPVGGGGTLAGIWRAFVELESRGTIKACPRLVAVLPKHYTLLETALNRAIQSEDEMRALPAIDPAVTIQAKIAMAYPPDGLEAVQALRDSGGIVIYSSDGEVLAAQRRFASCEGIYAEPSAAAAWVAVEKLMEAKRVQRGETVVAIITGSGFRETETITDRQMVTTTPVDRTSGLRILEKLCAN